MSIKGHNSDKMTYAVTFPVSTYRPCDSEHVCEVWDYLLL